MCDAIMAPNGEISSLAGIRAQGWIVAPEDVEPGMEGDTCFCWVNVDAVLSRNGVEYDTDVFGYILAEPLTKPWADLPGVPATTEQGDQ